MISDGRHCLAFHGESSLWHYDTRWRKQSVVQINGHSKDIHAIEGTGALLLVSTVTDELGTTRVTATVHVPGNPGEPAAIGEYVTRWTFEGDSAAWRFVPDYLIVREPQPTLLRIADDARPIPLDDLQEATSVVNVPESRLIVLTGGGVLGVLDPISGRSAAKMRLGQGTVSPKAAFSTIKGEPHLWINDGCLLIKLETKNWRVVDAAGPEDESIIQSWRFLDDSHVLVVPQAKAEVSLIDVAEMSLVESYFPPAPLRDLASTPDGKLFGLDVNGDVWRANAADALNAKLNSAL